jgi:hypothetical protein
VGSDGSAWTPAGTAFRRPPGAVGASVTVAVNADYRWGPGDWEQSGWKNRVEGTGDLVHFSASSTRRDMAVVAMAWLALLVVLAGLGSWLGRER